MSSGPLAGLRVVEFAALAPAPFAAMMLADHGAEVVRVDRPVPTVPGPDLLGRGRMTLSADLKDPDQRDAVAGLVDAADVLIEGFRPGVMERLGLGPEACLDRNPRLVYGRMTGWGQTGPLATAAGHDLNYIALSGALGAIGPADEPPTAPLNLVGDFGGGGLLLAFGILAALVERGASGRGQVVDAAMVDGAALLTTHLHSLMAGGEWPSERGRNLLDGGAPFYRTYRTADGRFMSVGAIEPQFYAELLVGIGLDPAELPAQDDVAGWPELQARFAEIFASEDRDHWTTVFGTGDACVHPVLDPAEVAGSPLERARRSFVEVDEIPQPGPAPRFARTPSGAPSARRGIDPAVLCRWGLPDEHIARISGTRDRQEAMTP